VRVDAVRSGLVSAGRYRIRYLHPAQIARPLATRHPVFQLDLNSAEDASLPTRLSARYQVEGEGRLDGFCVSFVAHFHDELRLDSSPTDLQRARRRG
jgi:hypothetical protein